MNIKKICGYAHNSYLHEYGSGYRTNIYPAGRVHGSYYPYPTRPVDILVPVRFLINLKTLQVGF